MIVEQSKYQVDKMTTTELIEAIQQDLRKLNTTYEAHLMIERIMQMYKNKVSEHGVSEEKKIS